MTDSGLPPDSQAPDVPPWAPARHDSAPEDPPAARQVPHPPAPATLAPASGVPYVADVAATMRLIPVPPPSTPPPPIPVMITPTTPTRERYIGKYRVKGELGRGGMGTVYLCLL